MRGHMFTRQVRCRSSDRSILVINGILKAETLKGAFR